MKSVANRFVTICSELLLASLSCCFHTAPAGTIFAQPNEIEYNFHFKYTAKLGCFGLKCIIVLKERNHRCNLARCGQARQILYDPRRGDGKLREAGSYYYEKMDGILSHCMLSLDSTRRPNVYNFRAYCCITNSNILGFTQTKIWGNSSSHQLRFQATQQTRSKRKRTRRRNIRSGTHPTFTYGNTCQSNAD
jgi:hypothetical protein